MDYAKLIDDALIAALAEYQSKMENPFPYPVNVVADPTHQFRATVAPHGESHAITISRGVIEALIELWTNASKNPALLLVDGEKSYDQPSGLIHGSLIWLIHHELAHIEMRHLSLTGGAGLTEIGATDPLGLVGHTPVRPAPLDGLSPADQSALRKTMELQADHEAIDMVIGRYAEIDPITIRTAASCAFAVAALIEVHDCVARGERISHPRAATRFFQIAGHIFQLPAIQDAFSDAQKPVLGGGVLPAYLETTFKPIMNDAIVLATYAGADQFIDDTSNRQGLIADIEAAFMGEATIEDAHTEGLKEYLSLVPSLAKLQVLLDQAQPNPDFSKFGNVRGLVQLDTEGSDKAH